MQRFCKLLVQIWLSLQMCCYATPDCLSHVTTNLSVPQVFFIQSFYVGSSDTCFLYFSEVSLYFGGGNEDSLLFVIFSEPWSITFLWNTIWEVNTSDLEGLLNFPTTSSYNTQTLMSWSLSTYFLTTRGSTLQFGTIELEVKCFLIFKAYSLHL